MYHIINMNFCSGFLLCFSFFLLSNLIKSKIEFHLFLTWPDLCSKVCKCRYDVSFYFDEIRKWATDPHRWHISTYGNTQNTSFAQIYEFTTIWSYYYGAKNLFTLQNAILSDFQDILAKIKYYELWIMIEIEKINNKIVDKRSLNNNTRMHYVSKLLSISNRASDFFTII